jgi:hypothetical protein
MVNSFTYSFFYYNAFLEKIEITYTIHNFQTISTR